MADLIQGKPLDNVESDSMVPSTQYITHQTQGDDDYPSSDETDSDDFQQLRVNVTRPVYTQDQFDVDNEHHSRQHTTLREWAIRKRKRNACSGECLKRNLYKFLPFTKILQSYNLKQDLIKDLIAGLTVGIMHLPQGMAYGMLANLPPVYGLYVSFFPVLVYFLFGTSKHISKGTFAVVSLMVGAVVEKEGLCPSSVSSVQSPGVPGSSDANSSASFAYNGSQLNSTSVPPHGMSNEELMCKVGLATATTFIVGVYHLLMGLFKLGFVSIYLSDPLTRGFTTATAVHVLTSQLKHTFGVPVDRFSGPFKIIYWYTDFFRKIALTNVASLIMCVLCMAVIYLTKEYINPRVKAKIRMPVPIELIVIIVSTLMSYLAKFEDKFSMIVVGAIPTGIPAPTVPPVAARFNDVFVDAIGIALVAFAVDLSMGKLLANKHDYHVEANQELRAYGITNLVCSFFNCFVPVASLSRSLVQEAVGGVTQIAGLFSCCLLVLVLLFVGPLFEQLPNNVLSAIVIVNLKGMFLQLLDLRTLWRASKTDMMIWLVVFLSTVLIDVDIGLFVGLGFSLLTVVYRTQAPYTSLLGRVPNTDIYKDISIYNCSREIPGVKIFRFECSLVYANVEYFVKKLYKKTVNPWAIKKMKQKLRNNLNSRSVQNNDDEIPTENQDTELAIINGSSEQPLPPASDLNIPKVVVLDCSTMADIDFPGATGLIKVIKEYKDANIDVMLAGCKSGVREMLEAAGFNDKLCCRNCMYLSIHDAVVAAINKYPSIRHQQNIGDFLPQLESDKDSILGMHNGHMISHHDNQDDDLGNYSNPENPLLDGAKNNN